MLRNELKEDESLTSYNNTPLLAMFLGKFVGAGVSLLDSRDSRICIELLSEDDGHWSVLRTPVLMEHTDDLAEALQQAQFWIQTYCAALYSTNGRNLGWYLK